MAVSLRQNLLKRGFSFLPRMPDIDGEVITLEDGKLSPIIELAKVQANSKRQRKRSSNETAPQTAKKDN